MNTLSLLFTSVTLFALCISLMYIFKSGVEDSNKLFEEKLKRSDCQVIEIGSQSVKILKENMTLILCEEKL